MAKQKYKWRDITIEDRESGKVFWARGDLDNKNGCEVKFNEEWGCWAKYPQQHILLRVVQIRELIDASA